MLINVCKTANFDDCSAILSGIVEYTHAAYLMIHQGRINIADIDKRTGISIL